MDEVLKTLDYLKIRFDELADQSEDLYNHRKRNGTIDEKVAGKVEAYRGALMLVIELEEETREKEKNNGWINVNDRLPDEIEMERANIGEGEGSEFLVMIKGGKVPTTLCLMEDGKWVDSRSINYTVTHWRELPNPPKNVRNVSAMSKAILVIDMPKNCADCPLKSQLRAGLSNVTHCCNLTESMIKLDEMFEKRLDGCPLRKLPERLPEEYDLVRQDNNGEWKKCGTEKDSVAIGFNQCLDMIEGRKNE